MAPRFTIDPVPQPMAGAMSVKCECGWETVFILPEEHVTLMQAVFFHITQVHHIRLPEICFQWH